MKILVMAVVMLYIQTSSGTLNPPKVTPKSCVTKPPYSKVKPTATKLVITTTTATPGVCKENEVMSTCGNNPCQPTCERPSIALCSFNPIICRPGCVCRARYMRDARGVCVPQETCVVMCPDRTTEYLVCGPGCPETCESIGKNITCDLPCVDDCFCITDFIQDERTGKCILPEECPPRCKENESYQICADCEKTCENKDLNVTCTNNCQKGCLCLDGYVRDENNRCILPQNCPLKCGENEVLNPCSNPCPPGAQCLVACIPLCECLPGYIRNSSNKCVKKPIVNPTIPPPKKTTPCASKKATTCKVNTTKSTKSCVTPKPTTKCQKVTTRKC